MNIQRRWLPLLCGLCLTVGLLAPVRAEVAASAEAASAVSAANSRLDAAEPDKTERGEPAVRNTVIEDDGARIDELKVRGQSKRITVTPKKGGKPYEIITDKGAREHTEGPNGLNGAVGKRVWPVMSF
jgi:hypothetical protein